MLPNTKQSSGKNPSTYKTEKGVSLTTDSPLLENFRSHS